MGDFCGFSVSVEVMALLVGFEVLQHTMRKTSFKTRQTKSI